MQKISTLRTSGNNIFQGPLTIGLDLGDRSSAYCILNESRRNSFGSINWRPHRKP